MRLADSDADYVQVIHTDGNKLAFAKPLGQGTDFLSYFFEINSQIQKCMKFSGDFYPNGLPSEQPGCPQHNKLVNEFGIVFHVIFKRKEKISIAKC